METKDFILALRRAGATIKEGEFTIEAKLGCASAIFDKDTEEWNVEGTYTKEGRTIYKALLVEGAKFDKETERNFED